MPIHPDPRLLATLALVVPLSALLAGGCGEEERPRTIAPSGSSVGSGGNGGDGGMGDAGYPPGPPLGEEDDVYLVVDDEGCGYDWLWPGCDRNAGEACASAIQCLPVCCHCEDGTGFAAGACDLASEGEMGVCAEPGSVCYDPAVQAQACGTTGP
jgi:hypothetical protein